ncbi:MAG TPA: hypothetical protein VES40_13055, partial [Ilumatobacteraceae bacterium]|nr:hypothetical protein [Ilumatobacteraceae bacterium]
LPDPTSDETRPDEAGLPERRRGLARPTRPSPPHLGPKLTRPNEPELAGPTLTTSAGKSRSTGPAAANRRQTQLVPFDEGDGLYTA